MRHYTNPHLPYCCTTDGILTAFEFCDGIGEGVDLHVNYLIYGTI